MKSNIFPLALIYVFLATFLWRATTNMFYTSIPLLSSYYLGLTRAEIGFVSGIISFASFIVSFYINQRIVNMKRWVAFWLSILSSLTILIAFANSFDIWVLAFIAGMSMGAVSPQLVTSAGMIGNRKFQERAIAIYTLALSASLVVGPLLQGVLLDIFSDDLRLSMALFLPITAASVLVSRRLNLPINRRTAGKTDRGIIRQHEFWASISINAIYTLPFAAIITYGGIFSKSIYAMNYTYTMITYSIFFGTSFMMRFLLSARPVKDMFRLVTIGTLLTVGGLSMIFLSPSIFIYMLGYAILGAPHGMFWPISLIYLRRAFGDERIANANSYFMSFNSLLSIAVPFLLGLLTTVVSLRNLFGLVLIPSIAVYMIYLYTAKAKVTTPISGTG